MQRLLKANEVVNCGFVTSSPNERIDSREIEPYLPFAESYWVAAYLPVAMWSDMVDKRTTDNINYDAALGPINVGFPNDANYEALFSGYLYRAIALAALYESIEAIGIKATALGVNQNNPRNGIAADYDVIKARKNTIANQMVMCVREMLAYLNANATEFPLFTPVLDGCGKPKTISVYPLNFPI